MQCGIRISICGTRTLGAGGTTICSRWSWENYIPSCVQNVGKGVNQRIWGRARVNRYKHRTIKWASRNGYTVRGVRKLGKDFRDVASYSARRRAVTYVERRISAAAGGIGSYYLGTRI